MLGKRIGIDLGGSRIRAFVKGEGLVADEPALVALDRRSRVVGVGERALEAAGRRSGSVLSSAGFRDGALADAPCLKAVLEHLIGTARARRAFFRPQVSISVAWWLSGRARRALLRAALEAGASQAWLVDTPLAAAIGAGLAVAGTTAVAVCHVGAGAAQMAVICGGGMVGARSSPVGGDRLEAALCEWLRSHRRLEVDPEVTGQARAEQGSSIPVDDQQGREVSGRDMDTGLARQLTVTSVEVAQAARKPLHALAEDLGRLLAEIPPGLCGEVSQQGLVLTGGGAWLPGVVPCLAAEVGFPVRLAGDAAGCAAKGAGLALDELPMLRRHHGHFR